MPPHAYTYALPYSMYTSHGIRRYGFHGISHSYVTRKAAEFLGKPLNAINIITLHLGNGASAAAIKSGQCIDTSMGMTPLEGLIMGTRCGNIDPSIHFHLQRVMKLKSDELENILNNESGLLGTCGTNDMREIETRAADGDELAELAIKMYCYVIQKYIGAYYAVLGSLDAIVFTGGVGENSSLIRQRSCEGLQCIGIKLNKNKNSAVADEFLEVHEIDSCKILVIRTNEEKEIAQQIIEKEALP
jgi:acetate kinase